MDYHWGNDGIATISFDRPPVNAFAADDVERLHNLLHHLIAEDARALVVTGRNGVFSAGLHRDLLSSDGSDGLDEVVHSLAAVVRQLAISPIPVIAAIPGHCIGAGFAIAVACDYRVAANGTYRLGLPEVRLGLPVSGRVCRLVARLAGPIVAQRVCAEAVDLTATEAHELGVIDRLTEAERVVPTALEWLTAVLALPKSAMLASRANARADIACIFDEHDEGIADD